MKRIRIYGCKNQGELKDKIRSAITYYRDSLLPHKRKLDLTVSLKKHFWQSRGLFGECWNTSYYNYPAYSFNIVIDADLEEEDLFSTLAHEMVHVKQFAKGELYFGIKQNKWLGKIYPCNTPYNQQPWEKEATEIEEKLYHAWKSNKYLDD